MTRLLENLLALLAAIMVGLVIATDPWFSETLVGGAFAVLCVAVVGGIAWVCGYLEGKKDARD